MTRVRVRCSARGSDRGRVTWEALSTRHDAEPVTAPERLDNRASRWPIGPRESREPGGGSPRISAFVAEAVSDHRQRLPRSVVGRSLPRGAGGVRPESGPAAEAPVSPARGAARAVERRVTDSRRPGALGRRSGEAIRGARGEHCDGCGRRTPPPRAALPGPAAVSWFAAAQRLTGRRASAMGAVRRLDELGQPFHVKQPLLRPAARVRPRGAALGRRCRRPWRCSSGP